MPRLSKKTTSEDAAAPSSSVAGRNEVKRPLEVFNAGKIFSSPDPDTGPAMCSALPS
jgi:hypothetical protein